MDLRVRAVGHCAELAALSSETEESPGRVSCLRPAWPPTEAGPGTSLLSSVVFLSPDRGDRPIAHLPFRHVCFFRSHPAWAWEEWASRKSWWPSFHFSYFWAKSDWKEDNALAYEKAVVAGMLLGKGTCSCFFLT